jgi:hypothetical protein
MRRNLDIADTNIDDVRLTPQPMATVRGRVTLPKSVSVSTSAITVQLHRLDEDQDFFDSMAFSREGGMGRTTCRPTEA